MQVVLLLDGFQIRPSTTSAVNVFFVFESRLNVQTSELESHDWNLDRKVKYN